MLKWLVRNKNIVLAAAKLTAYFLATAGSWHGNEFLQLTPRAAPIRKLCTHNIAELAEQWLLYLSI